MNAQKGVERAILRRQTDRELEAPALLTQTDDRRGEPRYPTSERAFMHTVFPDWTRRRLVRILDVSRQDVRIETVEYVPPGSSIRVQLKETFVLGEVRYCNPVDERFHVGILVQEVFEIANCVAAD